jgi:hypothetical protein
MAVAQGFSKITTSGSVFMYDTADTVNSYKGEPTTNYFLAQGTAGPGSASDNNVTFPINGTGTFVRLGYGQTFGGYTIQPGDVVYKYDLGSNGCHYHGMVASIPTSTYATFTFDYYVSPSTTIESTFLANFENYGGNALGGSVSAPNSLTGVWQTVTFTSGPTGGTGTQAMFLYPGGCGPRFGNTGYILYKNAQVEWNQHSTPFVNGTRSVSGSLFPLIGNNTFNLSNVSFNSAAQITFDGTNDTIGIPSNSDNNIAGNITMELILNRTAGSAAAAVMHKEVQYTLYIASNGTISYADSSNWSYGNFGFFNAGLTADVFHHVVATKNGSTVTIYVDGNVVVSQSFGSAITQTNNSLYIGSYDGSNAYFTGQIPVSRIYNRGLTPGEVLNNYNHYKTKYNLP